jgi:hypothetical protein
MLLVVWTVFAALATWLVVHASVRVVRHLRIDVAQALLWLGLAETPYDRR